jgi:biotin carboxyl carrier protein
MKFRVLLNEELKDIEVIRHGDRLRISYEGETHSARLIYTEGAHYVLELEEERPGNFISRKRIRAAGYHEGDNRQLWSNGQLVHYQIVRDGQEAPMDDEAASLSASIPAVVSEILVDLGEEVESGQKLILLESMKMILPIQAPYDGIVKAIHCSADEAVQPGFQLIELEEKS